MTYDFSSLSPTDFEQLVADLLFHEWGTRLESFKDGKDGGIDLLNSRSSENEPNTIIQCKRYAPDKLSALKSSLKEEVKKLKKLKFDRYVLVTSVPLSKANKEDIIAILTPYCDSTDDIYGGTEVNGLIRNYPAVERAHFKLWIGSTAILERVLNSKIFTITEATIAATLQEIRKLVPHPGLQRALEILNQNGHVLIVGNPGIGKTTLARMLLCHYLKDNYSPVWVVGNIDEAWSLVHGAITGQQKMVLVYDDFLGQAKFSTDKLDKNEDKSLFHLIDECFKAPNIRLILTTREYILEDAKNQHGTLHDRAGDLKKCTVSVEDYGTGTRGQILFNHLYFSDLPDSKLFRVLATKIYYKVLSHRNFNPRVIETISRNANSRQLSDDEFVEYIEKEFNNPSKLWSHPFEREISAYSRQLLVVLWSFGREVTFDELMNGLVALNPKVELEIVESEFKDSLRQLDGNFVYTFRLPAAWHPETFKYQVVRFQNPSVREFVAGEVQRSSSWIVRLAETLLNIDQLDELLEVAEVANNVGLSQKFWLALRDSALRVENEKRKYQMNCGTDDGRASYPALQVDLQFKAHTSLQLLKIEKKIVLKDDCSRDILNRITDSEEWLSYLLDMLRSYDAHRKIDRLVEWISVQNWSRGMLDAVRDSIKTALLEYTSDRNGGDMWNITTVFNCVTSLNIAITNEEKKCLLLGVSEAMDDIIRNNDVGTFYEQLDLLKNLEKEIGGDFEEYKELLERAIEEYDGGYEPERSPVEDNFTSSYTEDKINIDHLFSGLMDRNI
ncbi:nSTAND3 domain-containing NTPase [Janthinobacterium aestuarii]